MAWKNQLGPFPPSTRLSAVDGTEARVGRGHRALAPGNPSPPFAPHPSQPQPHVVSLRSVGGPRASRLSCTPPPLRTSPSRLRPSVLLRTLSNTNERTPRHRTQRTQQSTATQTLTFVWAGMSLPSHRHRHRALRICARELWRLA